HLALLSFPTRRSSDLVSLVVRGEDAVELRNVGMSTVDKLAALDPEGESPIQWTGTTFADAVALARAWLADLTVVRRVETVRVPRDRKSTRLNSSHVKI